MRNTEKDAAEMAARREKILETAYRVFAEHRITPVTMNDIAKAAGIGVATLYRYYSSKPDLVVAVGTWVWQDFFAQNQTRADSEAMTAAEELAFYLDSFLELYRRHPAILRFNQFFNVYMQNIQISSEALQPYTDMIGTIYAKFAKMYARAERDGTVRTDMSAKQMFSYTLHIMLAAVTRYAVGLVYQPDGDINPEAELVLLRNTLLRELTTKNA